MIKPTVGRVVWGYGLPGARRDDTQPFDAHITYVWSDKLVNIVYFDHQGDMHKLTSARLVQDDEPTPGIENLNSIGPHVRWMPYQVGQAKKNETT